MGRTDVWRGLAILLLLALACQPIDPFIAGEIPGTYEVTFEELQVKLGGVALVQQQEGLYKTAAGLTFDFRKTGCLQGGQPPNKTICFCEEFQVCPNQAERATAAVSLPQAGQKANNQMVVDVQFPHLAEKVHLEGVMDGRRLDFVIGLKLVLERQKVGKLDCLTAEESDTTGSGELSANSYTGILRGRVRAVWAKGCQFGAIRLGGALTLLRSFKAVKEGSSGGENSRETVTDGGNVD